ncbi:DNA methyltransferase [Pseudomonas resinovorans]|uniref:Methyltransferase n=1 Tax=Metapseudomonas resinovorans TaxID=53412 RepID=A0ABT4Y8X6_METRE|nr:DNA methyltransferase [Pseudomonas resinovorans]MDA8485124.1 DNA methyltransferase [Pseudomonas resinovorans]
MTPSHQILVGDSIEMMRTLPDQSVDMILTDLPYGTTQCRWDSVIPFEPMWEQYLRVAKPNAAIVLMSAQPFTSLLVASNLARFRYEWIWEKGNATGFLNAKKQPLRAHENAVVFYREQPTFNPQMTHGHERKTTRRKMVNSECYGKALELTEYDSTSRYPRDVQFFSSDKQLGSYHPTQKPVALMRYFVETYTDRGQVVLDSCAGSGTTAVACVFTERHSISIENDPAYPPVIAARIEEATDSLAAASAQLDIFNDSKESA